MSYKVLYRKYRPNDFDNVVGQDYTVEMLKNAINTGKHAHAYILLDLVELVKLVVQRYLLKH